MEPTDERPEGWIARCKLTKQGLGRVYSRRGDATAIITRTCKPSWIKREPEDFEVVALYTREPKTAILRKTLLERIEALRLDGAKGLFDENGDWPENFDFGDIDEIELLEAYEQMLIYAMGPEG